MSHVSSTSGQLGGCQNPTRPLTSPESSSSTAHDPNPLLGGRWGSGRQMSQRAQMDAIREQNASPGRTRDAQESATTPTSSSGGGLDAVQAGLDGLSIGLDATGAGAVLSPIVDAANGLISLVRGDYAGAALSAWAAVPWVGVSGNLARLSRAAAGIDRKYAGRALQKHSSRPGSAFSTSVTRAADLNAAGQSVVDDILTSPGSVQRGNRLGGVDVVAPDGRGVRFNPDGSFRGFLEP